MQKNTRRYLIEMLRSEIRSGKYQVGSKFPSEYELADQYGFNRITVNKAVSILVEEGYLSRASCSRGGTIIKQTRLFPEGIIGCIANIKGSFASSIVAGAIKAAAKNNYIISPTCPEIDELAMVLRKMEMAKFSGILSLHYGRLHTSLPIVYIDESGLREDKDTNIVLSDDYGGGEAIAENILSFGHKNIVYFSNSSSVYYKVDFRQSGVIEAMRRNGISDAKSRCFSCNENSVHHCLLALKEALDKYPNFSAIICNTDHLALNIIRAGQQLGLNIPGEISISGFGNIREVQEAYHLTTVDQHPQELGIRACERLLEINRTQSDKTFKHQFVSIELIAGQSVRIPADFK